ncbi:MAG: type II toxin-antitoxin system VapC family toxin [Propioniciclava sp.]|uniref:type II toxin-antitoxin system VapC family toxin n=1 Tax=Propioniciclava sp. TaxID=2038686 RepID=UPI0039E521F6
MSDYLLDTNALYWLMTDDPRLGAEARERLSQASTVHYSAASIWELEIKRLRGRFGNLAPFGRITPAIGVDELPVTAEHAHSIGTTELPHHDPFDRILLTQATVEGLTFITADQVLLGLGRDDVLDARR